LNNRGTSVNLSVSNKNVTMRQSILIAAAILLLVPASQANNSQAQLPIAFGRWTLGGPYSKRVLHFEARDPKGEVFSESGVWQLTSETYSLGVEHTTAILYAFHDSSGAYEAFTYLRSPNMVTFDSSLSQAGAFDRDRALLCAGNFLVEVAPASDVSIGDLEDLLRRIAVVADKTPSPPIQNYLPNEGRDASGSLYALGPVAFRSAVETLGRPEFASLADAVGFSSGAEAMLARYKAGALLILIDYPTPQLAELHLRHLESSLPEKAKQGGATVERKGSLLSIVMAPAMPGYAAKLRDGVNYETQVTWNEPSGTATDPPWSVILYRIFVGTGIFMGAAVVLGIAFGGLRVFTKRLLPGKIFDRPERMEILQLGLSGKTIDPRDFY
jgi:hypothetical protein